MEKSAGNAWKPMLSTPCESVQISTDPDRYSRIVRKLKSRKFSFENEISWLKSALRKKHASYLKF